MDGRRWESCRCYQIQNSKSRMISVLILTRNEEEMLPRCLEAVRWSDDIIIFYSFSTDRTIEIAKSFGARVFQRAFDNERDQRAASLQLQFKHPWVYNPDADEITTAELRDEMPIAFDSKPSFVTDG
jgi:glycosyltransferase involved in cell wall biosynthesis